MTGASAAAPEVRAAFDDHLAHADESGATALAMSLLRSGTTAEDVLLRLIAPAQAAVGARWLSTEWTVAQEHDATHVSECVVKAVAAAACPPRPRDSASRAPVSCSPASRVSGTLSPRGSPPRYCGCAAST